MNRVMLLLAIVAVSAASVGCQQIGSNPCTNPTSVSAQPLPDPIGPGTGQTAYPYYTTRGPRDFLTPEPYDIGY